MYRFLASPTKDISIDDLRVALLNYICAKQNNELFIVRIEDSGKAQKSETLELLSLFGLKYDYLYSQSENFKHHLQFASSLMDKGLAFACFCKEDALQDGTCTKECNNISQQELLNNNLPFTIRLKDKRDNFLIMNQQKYPTANFANACDDMLQGVTSIIEEEKNSLDFPKQELVRKSLGYNEEIKYTHIPSLINAQEYSVPSLIKDGFLPEAILNYLLLLDFKAPKEIFTLSEVLDWFSMKDIATTPQPFDKEKLKQINEKHIKNIGEVTK